MSVILEKIDALIEGEQVNQSEKRPALHTALRCQDKNLLLLISEISSLMSIALVKNTIYF
ncbi:hypothetical protein [Legionella tunisiensis]|uniref:hypothetical protein n=1 Tax=Legionella tunisiensis TaxID=1034944 RepID=UPI0002D4650A|nr:hypothetical protein [Legionella tunisiensis]